MDVTALESLRSLQHAWLDAAFASVTWLGSVMVLGPLIALLAWRLARDHARRAAGFMIASLAGSVALVHLAKETIARPRPDVQWALITMPADASFPSAHTAQVAAAAVSFGLLFRYGRVWAAAGVVVLLVALSRIYLQVHFPSDVLAGLILGSGWAAGLYVLLRPARREWGAPQ